jgi:hypothetical protein
LIMRTLSYSYVLNFSITGPTLQEVPYNSFR